MDDILFYTQLHTYDKYSIETLNLLYNSLKYSFGDINFKIVIRKGDIEKYPENLKSKIIESPYNNNYEYSGDLKYSEVIINEKYSRYVYLDCDILWLLKDNKFNKNQYCIEKSNEYQWFYYGYEFFEDSLSFFKNLKDSNIDLINAGFFSIDKNNFILLCNFFKEKFNKKIIPNKQDQLMFEQSIFNMFINLNPNIFWQDLSDKIVLFANENYLGDKIYHFCGRATMEEKANRMKNFLIKNNLKGILDSAD